ncbi:hypothetical protein D3C84_792930 [compost metagenome]
MAQPAAPDAVGPQPWLRGNKLCPRHRGSQRTQTAPTPRTNRYGRFDPVRPAAGKAHAWRKRSMRAVPLVRHGDQLPVSPARYRDRNPNRRERDTRGRTHQSPQGQPQQHSALDATPAGGMGSCQASARHDLGQEEDANPGSARAAQDHRGSPRRRTAEVESGHCLAATGGTGH